MPRAPVPPARPRPSRGTAPPALGPRGRARSLKQDATGARGKRRALAASATITRASTLSFAIVLGSSDSSNRRCLSSFG
eukprot:2444555-Pleurochrysis_carterae.AAC.1